MSEKTKMFVGSRKSELALIQTRYVISLLKEINPSHDFEIVTMSTLGDKVLDVPLPKIGEKSLFTKELEAALISGDVDFVVHSLKDLPTTLPQGMAIGAVLAREDPRDALVLKKGFNEQELNSMPEGSVIGTSSLRRGAQLARKYPHLKVENIRGNLNTRLRKLDELDQFNGIILAAAGLIRMGWVSRITKILECDELLYAVGQGALAVECREDDYKTINLLKPLYDVQTCLRVITERTFLKTLGGGCSAPVAISTELLKIKNNKYCLKVKGAVWSLDGSEEIIDSDESNVEIKELFKSCPKCPYATATNDNVKCDDIESIKNCIQCPSSSSPTIPVKRARIESDVNINLLKDDPHEQCPLSLPVGVDFMGKCPYLESGLVTIHGKLSNPKNMNEIDLSKCPFFNKSQKINISPSSSVTSEKNKTICGLVPHPATSIKSLEQAQDLGLRLARNLMNKGASKVMAKAQATIHDSINSKSS